MDDPQEHLALWIQIFVVRKTLYIAPYALS